MTAPEESGQTLLIAVLIFLVLIITIPAMIFINQHATSHGVMSQKKLKGRAIAEEGIAFAIQQLQTSGPNFSACPAGLGFNGTTQFKSTQGGAYYISCIPNGYQAIVKAIPLDTSINPTNPPVIPGSSIQTIVSQRTLGAKLPTGLAAPAAINLGRSSDFSTGGNIKTYFGPMVCWDADLTHPPWTLDPWSAANQWPRKFSVGVITDHPNPPFTDQKEYWAFTDVGFHNVVDVTFPPQPPAGFYFNSAQASNVGAWPNNSCTPNPPTCLPGQVGTTGVFNPTQGQLLFDNAAAPQGSVFLVNGDAQIKDLALDLKDATNVGAIIVTGNLTIIPHTGNPGLNGTIPVRVPPSAYLEYPFDPPPNPTCQGIDPPPCSLNAILGPGIHRLNFRGFLYVHGNMDVQDDFVMAGVLQVDGNLTIATTPTIKTLTVIYDDQINREIKVTPFELQIDSTTAVP